jgi:response regulator RpfG family c-di-GMP phosphodiesterase
MASLVDELLFQDDEPMVFIEEESEKTTEKWNVLIVDDEKEVHAVTKLVLSDFVFEGKALNFISAYSSTEAEEIIAGNDDIAVILLDVVMETDDAGLRLVEYVREELGNKLVRIVLRTGQPGQAPEKRVIVDYDINDYKEKTEITAQRLFTILVSSLRSYRDLKTINENKEGLEKIVESSSSIFRLQSVEKFASNVLSQLISMLSTRNCGEFISGFTAAKEKDEFYILAASGKYTDTLGTKFQGVMKDNILNTVIDIKDSKKVIYSQGYLLAFFRTPAGYESIIYVDGVKEPNDFDKYLIEIFFGNISVGIDNIYLNREVENTQKEIVFTLGEVAEVRSKETSNHVKRVAEYSYILALKYGLGEDEAELIRMASPMHDIGKLAIPDSILNKPGKLTEEEFDIIKTHSMVGYDILKSSNREILKAASIIAVQHHEKYNGTGYPNGLKGEDIHIYGRITAVADVFDALGSARIYKPAWELDRILDLFQLERGKQFDPKLVDLFIDSLDEIIKIRDMFRDL